MEWVAKNNKIRSIKKKKFLKLIYKLIIAAAVAVKTMKMIAVIMNISRNA